MDFQPYVSALTVVAACVGIPSTIVLLRLNSAKSKADRRAVERRSERIAEAVLGYTDPDTGEVTPPLGAQVKNAVHEIKTSLAEAVEALRHGQSEHGRRIDRLESDVSAVRAQIDVLTATHRVMSTQPQVQVQVDKGTSSHTHEGALP